ncbi:MAG: hypothetical protein KAT86_05240, partial [Candidatus Latescibacteria bacterium]|nr:hypothetical protein [Candidatus Latescibacterota bacterium]
RKDPLGPSHINTEQKGLRKPGAKKNGGPEESVPFSSGSDQPFARRGTPRLRRVRSPLTANHVSSLSAF